MQWMPMLNKVQAQVPEFHKVQDQNRSQTMPQVETTAWEKLNRHEDAWGQLSPRSANAWTGPIWEPALPLPSLNVQASCTHTGFSRRCLSGSEYGYDTETEYSMGLVRSERIITTSLDGLPTVPDPGQWLSGTSAMDEINDNRAAGCPALDADVGSDSRSALHRHFVQEVTHTNDNGVTLPPSLSAVFPVDGTERSGSYQCVIKNTFIDVSVPDALLESHSPQPFGSRRRSSSLPKDMGSPKRRPAKSGQYDDVEDFCEESVGFDFAPSTDEEFVDQEGIHQMTENMPLGWSPTFVEPSELQPVSKVPHSMRVGNDGSMESPIQHRSRVECLTGWDTALHRYGDVDAHPHNQPLLR